MPRNTLIALLCLLAVVSTGCKKAKLRSQLKELMAATIVLPDSIACIYKGEVYPMPDSLRDRSKLIVYIDSTECTGCRLSKLVQYSTFAESLRLLNTDFFVLITPKIGRKEYITDLVLSYEYPFSVYLDDKGIFLDVNPLYAGKPSNLYTVLIKRDQSPVLFGDPLSSDAMYRLFLNRIQTIYNQQK